MALGVERCAMQQLYIGSIASGMKDACDDVFDFSGKYGLLDCEYLLTVRVAQRLRADLKVQQGAPYQIYLEHKTRRFSSGCVPLFGKPKDGPPHRRIVRKVKNSSRNGRIDIAVYKENSGLPEPVFAVELKSFNPSKTSVLADLRRNLEFLRFEDATGQNRLSYAFFGALESFPKTTSDHQCLEDCAKLKTRYEGWLKELRICRHIRARVDAFHRVQGVLCNGLW